MNVVQRVAKNTVLLSGASVVSGLLNVFLNVIIARMLGDVGLGQYSFIIAFIALFSVLCDPGFNTLIIRDVARNKELSSKYLGNILAIKFVICVLVIGLIVIVTSFVHYSHDIQIAIYVYGFSTILRVIGDVFRMIFRAFERMEFEALVTVIRQVLITALCLAALFFGLGLIGIAFAFLIGSVLDVAFTFYLCGSKIVKPKVEMDIPFWKQATKSAVPIGVLSFADSILIKTDTVIISAMKGDAAVGWYNAAFNFVSTLQNIPYIFMSALMPLMSAYSFSSQDSLKRASEKALKVLLIIGLPIAVGATLLSERIILLLYGNQFSQSVIVLQILSWNIFVSFMTTVLGYLLISINRQNQMAIAALASAGLNILMNLLFIPTLSCTGSAIASLITNVCLFISYFYFVSRYLMIIPLHKIVFRPLLAGIVMATFIYFFKGINLPFLIVISAVLYFLILFLIKGFNNEDKEIILMIISRKKTEVIGRQS